VYGHSSSHICGGSCGGSGPEVTWPKVTSVTWLEVTSVTCPVRKYVLCMHNRKLRNILPSGAFWPEVTKSRDRKWSWPEVCSAHARFSPRFFLSSSTVVTWLPDVTGHLNPSGFPWVCACAAGSCATPIVTHSEVSLGCSLRRPRPIFSMVTGTSHPRPDSFFPSYPLRVYNRKSQQRSFYRHRFWWYRGSSENQFMECCIK
jgi:hypothetical protein